MEEPSGLSYGCHLLVRSDRLRFGLPLILDLQRSLLRGTVWIAQARFQALPCGLSNPRPVDFFSEMAKCCLREVLAYFSFAAYCLVHLLSLTYEDALFLSSLIQRGNARVAPRPYSQGSKANSLRCLFAGKRRTGLSPRASDRCGRCYSTKFALQSHSR